MCYHSLLDAWGLAIFQKLMYQVLQPHHHYAVAYLDNVIFYSPDWFTHLQNLAAVLQTLREAQLKANPKKCKVWKWEKKYLGYLVENSIVQPLVDKAEVLQTPHTKN